MKGFNLMFRSPFDRFTHTGLGFPGRAARRAVTWAASLAAITFLMLETLSSAAVAQSPANVNTPLRVYLARLTCLQQSNDNTWPNPDHDEPYVVIFAADLRGETAQSNVFLSPTYRDVDSLESRDVWLQFWSLNGTGSPISSANDFIFLVALMEEDDYRNPLVVLKSVSSSLTPAVENYRRAGMSRASMVSALRADMDRAIEVSRRRQYGDRDDRVGGIYEVFWGPNELQAARAGYAVDLLPTFVGSDSRYQLTFRLQ
jgi:hypothetical protein